MTISALPSPFRSETEASALPAASPAASPFITYPPPPAENGSPRSTPPGDVMPQTTKAAPASTAAPFSMPGAPTRISP